MFYLTYGIQTRKKKHYERRLPVNTERTGRSAVET